VKYQLTPSDDNQVVRVHNYHYEYRYRNNNEYVDGKLDTLSDAMFYGNPHEMTVEDIDEVIDFFENTEEYEKCSELLCIKDDKLAELITKKLMRNALFK